MEREEKGRGKGEGKGRRERIRESYDEVSGKRITERKEDEENFWDGKKRVKKSRDEFF